jgi:hypothetical protein
MYCADEACTATHTHTISAAWDLEITIQANRPRSTTTHESIFTITYFLCTHLQTNIPTTSRKEVRKRSKTAVTNFRWRFALFTSLRWITNNNNYYIFFSGPLERGKRGVPALCFAFFFLFSLCSYHNISYHSERLEWSEMRARRHSP